MVFAFIAFFAAAFVGWMRAQKRGGTWADKIQYALAHAIPVTILVLILVTFVARVLI